MKLKIKKGDMVQVQRGKDRGKTGKIMTVVTDTNRVVVEGIQMVKKHVRARRAGEKAQRVDVASPIPVSNVQVICGSCGKPTRVAIKSLEGKRMRTCKRCQAVLS